MNTIYKIKVLVMVDFSEFSTNELFAVIMIGLFVFSGIAALLLNELFLRKAATDDEVLKMKVYVKEACDYGDTDYQEIMKEMVGLCYRRRSITNRHINDVKKVRDSYFRALYLRDIKSRTRWCGK